jgi:ABC-type transport system involved in multi-copper enzyme maturation permease subunit
MEKEKIVVNYSVSGVKTLNGLGLFLLVVGVVALFVALILAIVFIASEYSKSGAIATALSFSITGATAFVSGAACLGLSNIARTALFKRTVLEHQYDFAERTPKQPKSESAEN